MQNILMLKPNLYLLSSPDVTFSDGQLFTKQKFAFNAICFISQFSISSINHLKTTITEFQLIQHY